VGKTHVPKHKLKTDPWVVFTGDGPLCMGGCGVRGVFSACVRRLLLNIKAWGRPFPYRSSFFYNIRELVNSRDSNKVFFIAHSYRRMGINKSNRTLSKCVIISKPNEYKGKIQLRF
jgi:hypothetical protein